MRSPLILILLLAITACHQAKPTESLTTEDLKYTAYTWHSGIDSNELYIAQYVAIDKNGHYAIMRHDTFMDNPKYFSGDIDNATRSLISKAFADNSYQKSYSFAKDSNVIYDGFTYLFDYTKREDGQKHTIQFIPSYSPIQIQNLATKLDKLIYLSDKNEARAFNLTEYESELIKNSLTQPLPKKEPPRVEIRKK